MTGRTVERDLNEFSVFPLDVVVRQRSCGWDWQGDAAAWSVEVGSVDAELGRAAPSSSSAAEYD